MIISHTHKFIFLKTRKTAGTSIEMALAKFCAPGDVISRIGSETDAKKKDVGYPGEQNFHVPLAGATWRDLAKIPLQGWPRFEEHSPASYVKQRIPAEIWNGYFKFAFERNPWDRFVSQFHWNSRGKSWNSMEEYFAATTAYRRSNWDIYAIDDQLALDFMGHYETMAEDLDYISERLGLPKVELPRTKTATRPEKSDHRVVLSPEAQRKVAIACAREIELFGYEFKQYLPKRSMRPIEQGGHTVTD